MIIQDVAPALLLIALAAWFVWLIRKTAEIDWYE